MTYHTTQAPQIIVEARARLMVKAVFFSCILYDQAKLQLLKPGETVWCGIECLTAMTDGRNLVMNMDFMAKLPNVNQRVFVFAHEVYHIMAMHPKRMRKYMTEGLFGLPFMPLLYNICADAVINKQLVDSRIGERPDDCVWIEKIGSYVVTGLELPEDLYKLKIDQLPQSTREALEGIGSNSDERLKGIGQSIANGIPGAGGPLSDDVIPISPDATADQVSEAQMKAAIVAAQQQAKSQGTMPAGLKRFIDDFLEEQVRWEDYLRQVVVGVVGRDISNWSRPNRRKLVLPGIYLPRRRGLRAGRVGVGWDTSGSVGPKEHQQFGGELASILGDVRPEVVYLMWCDARVDACVELQDPEELKIEAMVNGASGGGGTSFVPPFLYLKEHGIEVDTFIYFTDGYGPFPTVDQVNDCGLEAEDVIWCISSDVVAPFGTTIKITF